MKMKRFSFLKIEITITTPIAVIKWPQSNRCVGNSKFCLFIFSQVLILFAIIASCLRVLLYFSMTVRSSKNLHKNMLNRVLKTPIRFFDINPVGRIMNRFSKDIGIIDETIPITVLDFMNVKKHRLFPSLRHDFCEFKMLFQSSKFLMLVLGSIGFAVVLNYIIFIPLIPMTILFVYIRNYFLKTSMEIKRIEGIGKLLALVLYWWKNNI
jgi:ATP-binding cassette subfamily C (CFTR/MRP) protein 4